ncbi:MAG: sensor domain-containing diguanylate cyclase [Nanoarchaeota archaeon]
MALDDLLNNLSNPSTKQVLDGLQEAVVITGVDGSILYANSQFSKIVQAYYGKENPHGRNLFGDYNFEAKDQKAALLEECVSSGLAKQSRRVVYVRDDKSEHYYNIRMEPLKGANEKVEGVQVGFVDVTNEVLEAIKDELTGAFTKNHYLRQLFPTESARAIRAKRSGSEKESYLGVIVGDLQDFKKVNDTLGHSIGDDILKRTASLMMESVRPTDYVIRFGGDEFCVLLPNTDQAAANQVMARINSNIKKYNRGIRNPLMQIKMNFGVLSDNDNYEGILEKADAFMYANKRGAKEKGTPP